MPNQIWKGSNIVRHAALVWSVEILQLFVKTFLRKSRQVSHPRISGAIPLACIGRRGLHQDQGLGASQVHATGVYKNSLNHVKDTVNLEILLPDIMKSSLSILIHTLYEHPAIFTAQHGVLPWPDVPGHVPVHPGLPAWHQGAVLGVRRRAVAGGCRRLVWGVAGHWKEGGTVNTEWEVVAPVADVPVRELVNVLHRSQKWWSSTLLNQCTTCTILLNFLTLTTSALETN